MTRPDRRAERVVRAGALWVLSAVLLAVLVRTVVAPLYGPFRYDRTDALVAAVLLLLALAAFATGVRRVVQPLEDRPWVRRALVSASLAGLLLSQLAIGRALRVPPGFDAGIVHVIAATMASDQPVAPELFTYASIYPNNQLLIAILKHWFDLTSGVGVVDLLWSAVLLNTLAMTSAVLLTYLAARRLGAPAAAYVLLAFSWILIALSPWVAVAYSDTLAMPLTAAVLYLFSVERDVERPATRVGLWALMALVGTIGFHVKPTAVFALVAAVLVALAASGRPTRRQTATAMACAGVIVGGFLAVGAAADQVTARLGMTATDEVAPLRLDVSHFLKMGAQAQAGPHNDYYGSYWEADVAQTRSFAPGSERLRENLGVYLDRAGDMGPVGYPAFLFDKASWFLGDGSFFMWGEGGMVAEPMPWLATDDASRSIQEWFFIGGDHYPALFSLWQGTWLVVLLLLGASPLLRREHDVGATATAARVSLLLLGAFLLLFESRARYLYLYLPYFLLLGALSLDGLTARAGRLLRRERPEA